MIDQSSATDPATVKALALFAACGTWTRRHPRLGPDLFAVPTPGGPLPTALASPEACSCLARRHDRETCAHMRAVRLYVAAFGAGGVGLVRLEAAEGIALTPAGAVALLDPEAEPLPDPHLSEACGHPFPAPHDVSECLAALPRLEE